MQFCLICVAQSRTIVTTCFTITNQVKHKPFYYYTKASNDKSFFLFFAYL